MERTPLYNIFLEYERFGFLSNNCGDIFEKGNYKMDSKEIEKDILEMFARKFGIDKNPYWGYITSGGSESNSWGIDNGFRIYPKGILYYCESAHYSIKKHAERYRSICIPQVSPALYGGIPNNQVDAPIIKINEKEIDSISVSLHKYIGVPVVKSVLLSTRKPNCEVVPYIGMMDSTTSGSRDILPFSMRQQVFDVLNLTDKEEYTKNISLFERLLNEQKIPYIRSGKGNIFVMDKPSDALCEKFQLSTFEIYLDGKKINKAHIIIFPYQIDTIICELVHDLSKERGVL